MHARNIVQKAESSKKQGDWKFEHEFHEFSVRTHDEFLSDQKKFADALSAINKSLLRTFDDFNFKLEIHVRLQADSCFRHARLKIF